MRIHNSMRNISVALIGQILILLINFISRFIFIETLGNEYLGLNGLFTNILSILSLAEMGIGSAIIYSLYRPLSEEDNSQIAALMNFYKRAYRSIGCVILLLGLLLIPFLHYLIKDPININHLNLIYILFLLNSVVSYFYAYKKSLFIADQKSYITTIYRYSCIIALNIVQIIILLKYNSFILFLVVQILFTLLENILISIKADKQYSYLEKYKECTLKPEEKKEINKNVKALMLHRIGNVIVNGTDNLIISRFIGVATVGLYSNYFLITNAISIIIGQIFSSLTASVGNLSITEEAGKSYSIFKKILFINFWICGFFSIVLFELMNPFITLWIGEDFIFSSEVIFIIVINFFIAIARKTTLIFKDAYGLFWHDRYKPLIESILNMIISIILVKELGIIGVFLGTISATLLTSFWFEPYVLYKYGFCLKLRLYFIMCIKYTLVIIVTAYGNHLLFLKFAVFNWGDLIIKGLVSIVSINLFFVLFFYKTEEFKYFINLIKIYVERLSMVKDC